MPPLGRTTVTETADEAARSKARERVARSARAGQAPSAMYSEADLAWAFAGGHEAELEELEELAAEVPAAEAEQRESAERSRQLEAATDRVLAEWDAEEAAKRRAKAQAEARERLAWRKDERP
jgi:hypothetical protein